MKNFVGGNTPQPELKLALTFLYSVPFPFYLNFLDQTL